MPNLKVPNYFYLFTEVVESAIVWGDYLVR